MAYETPVFVTNRRLKAAIILKGVQQRDLAKEVGIAEGSLSQLVQGRFAPGADLKSRLAKALGVTVEEIF